jgi:hypothetical protein
MAAEQLTSDIRIQNLARTFPCLRGAPGVAGLWNALALDGWAATVASSGETHSARFVLGVWNSHEKWRCGRFDLFDALGVWDHKHLEPFLAWVENPWFA